MMGILILVVIVVIGFLLLRRIAGKLLLPLLALILLALLFSPGVSPLIPLLLTALGVMWLLRHKSVRGTK
jgi:hypothetical protein